MEQLTSKIFNNRVKKKMGSSAQNRWSLLTDIERQELTNRQHNTNPRNH